MTQEQIDIMQKQNQQLLEQNQQLIGLLSSAVAPVVLPKLKKKKTKKERIAVQVTSWYYHVSKKMSPELAARLMYNIKRKELWQA